MSRQRWWHVGVDGRWVAVAAAHVVGVVVGAAHTGLVGAALVAAAAVIARCGTGSRAVGLVIASTVLFGAWQGRAAWREVQPDRLGEWRGWALVAADPAPRGRATALTLEIEGERFDAYAYGSIARRLGRLAAGEYVHVAGGRVARNGTGARRAAVRHVVGVFEVASVGDVRAGTAIATAANRLRRTLRAVADDTMSPDEAALFSGLVIGDDSRQQPAMVERFRGAGLSHLTAVSGQNVAFVLAAAAPLLHRLSPRLRWFVSLTLIIWFMVVTRFEPSVLRAGMMAMLAASAFLAGRSAAPVRLLAISVAVLTSIDPLLVWSVGFWLSVSATVGVAVVAPCIERVLAVPRWCATALSVTLGAQLGVAIPSLVVFGRLPIVALAANPAAVPVAGLVMLIGVPSALLAAAVSVAGPAALADVVMLPSRFGTRWVDQVSRVAEVLEPPTPVAWAGWGVVVLWLLQGWRRNRVGCPTDVPI